MDVLASRVPLLAACVQEGFAAYFDHYGARASVHSSRTRANVIRDEVVAAASGRFADDEGVRVCGKEGRRILFVVDDRVIINFKKLDRQLKPMNYKTPTATAFNENMPLDGVGIPTSLPRLSVGYLPDVEHTQIDGIYVVFSYRGRLSWSADITQGFVTDEQMEIADLHEAPTAGRVRLKGEKDEEQRTAFGGTA